MAEVNKSNSPYFDDYNPDKKYHEVLYRPRRAVQVRELNQIQSMFNEQIKRLGEHTFEDGSVVIPGETNYDLELDYVTLNIPNYSSVEGLLGSPNIILRGDNGITARPKLFREVDGTDPATFYIEYGDSSDDTVFNKFQAGNQVEIVLDAQVIATADVIGDGIASKFTINNGVYYINGRFVLVEQETVLLDKYSNTPSKVVGIQYDEVIVTESEDNSLFDNAQGTPNFSAPGAHRLRVDTKLAVFDLDEDIPDDIVEIFRIEDGEIQKTYRGPDYNILGDVLAQRTYEESGDYTVKSFDIGFEPYNVVYDQQDDTKFAIQLDPGIAYVRGFRVETISKTNVEANKARETGIINNSSISASLGYYVEVENLSTIPSVQNLQSIEFKDSGGTTLGTARIRFIFEASTGVYRLYLFDVQDNAGNKTTAFIANSVSIASTDTVTFTADLVASELKDTNNNSLLFPLNVDFVRTLKPEGTSDTSYSSVKQVTGTLDTSGRITFTSSTFETFVSQDSRYAIGVYTDTNEFLDVANNFTLGGSPTGSIITLDFGSGNSGRPIRVNLQVAKEQVEQKTKTLQQTTATGTIDGEGKLALGKADGYSLVSVVDSSSNDLTSLFTLYPNKTRSYYDISYIQTNNTGISDTLTVTFEYFEHSAGDYFGPDSYVSVDYDNIPTEDGVRLTDVLDFRPRINDAGDSFTGTGSSVGNIPTPFTIIRADVEHYLPRIDKVYVKSDGQFGVTEGLPDLNPKEPDDPADAMVLYTLNVPAYTFELEDVQAEKINNRRYTMKDIGEIENRLSNVEYYVSLNYLEQEAEAKQVLDPVTGADRFKNGFLVDQFVDHSIADFAWEQYHVSVGDGELRPEFSLNAIDLEYDSSNSTNVVNNNGLVTLPYDNVSFVKQNQRSGTLNVNPYAVYRWSGSLKLNPSVDSWIDTVYANPEVTYRVFNNGRLTQNWNSWQLNWSGSTTRSSRSSRSGSFRTTRTTTTRTNVDVVNDRVIDKSVIPFMRTIDVSIDGEGNRPNTRLYFFFDNTSIDDYVRPQGGNFGSPVVTDDEGNFEATFRIPNNDEQKFRTGEKQLIATDEEGNRRELSTSYAQSTFASTGIRNTRRQTIVATRSIETRTTRRRIRWSDPLAQSFLVERDGGVFITKINTFFETKDDRTPVEIQIREMENGSPTQRVVPGGQKMLLPSQVNTSNDGSVATTFTFDQPVYLQDGIEYCFVLTSNSNAYNAFIAKMGERDLVSNRFIVKQPYAGVLFKSQNNSTWTEDQNSDLQFEIFCAKFDTNVTGTLETYNKDLDKIRLTANPIATTNGSSTLNVYRENHNYTVGTIVRLSGVTGANGIQSSTVNDVDLTVDSVVDPNHFTIVVSDTATATGDIGGTDVEITNTIQASLLSPNIPTIDLPNTNAQFSVRGTTGKSIDGDETPYIVQTGYIPVTNNNNNPLKQPWLITNSNDESSNLSGEKSFRMKATLRSTNSNVSPVIDLMGANIMTPFSQVTRKVAVDASGDNNWANYRTQISVLNNPADMVKAYLDVKKQEASEVIMTARFGNSNEEVEQASWVQIPNLSGGDTVADDYIENEFEIDGLNTFTHYQVMIQIKSSSAANYPVCRRLRILALSDFS